MISGLIADKYRVEGVVGSGGMGIVFSAVHIHLGERVAIKTLRPEMALRPHALARFLREARAAIRLRGEHIVRVFDAGTLDGGTAYIVMELLLGEDLSALVRGGPLPTETAVEYLLQACIAIAEAHAQGIVHRDLKPANLFLTHRADGSPCLKVLDFGISKTLEPDVPDVHSQTDPSSERGVPAAAEATAGAPPPAGAWLTQTLTSTRAAIGSPRYMSPEQVASAKRVDARADIWALGAILYELLGGSAAFDADGADALRAAVLEGSPRELVGPPPGLVAIAMRCLEKDRSRRFPDVGALARALAPYGPRGSKAQASRAERILAGSGSNERSPRAIEGRGSDFTFAATNADAISAPTPRRASAGRIGIVGALVLACAGATVALGRARTERPSVPLAVATFGSVVQSIAALPPAPAAVAKPVDAEPAPYPSPPASSPAAAAPRPGAPQTKPLDSAARAARAAPPRDPLHVIGGELFRARQ